LTQPFYDGADFEQVKRRAGGIQNWIEEQLKGCSVTAVLFGAETYHRPWVKYEIKRSFELKMGILAIDIQADKWSTIYIALSDLRLGAK
jgi:hypothetical protein